MAWQRVASVGQIEEGEAFPVSIGQTHIALVRVGDRVHGISNVCTHEFALLSDGIVEDDCIECPLHQARFDVALGRAAVRAGVRAPENLSDARPRRRVGAGRLRLVDEEAVRRGGGDKPATVFRCGGALPRMRPRKENGICNDVFT